jgi:hypothetical protein
MKASVSAATSSRHTIRRTGPTAQTNPTTSYIDSNRRPSSNRIRIDANSTPPGRPQTARCRNENAERGPENVFFVLHLLALILQSCHDSATKRRFSTSFQRHARRRHIHRGHGSLRETPRRGVSADLRMHVCIDLNHGNHERHGAAQTLSGVRFFSVFSVPSVVNQDSPFCHVLCFLATILFPRLIWASGCGIIAPDGNGRL